MQNTFCPKGIGEKESTLSKESEKQSSSETEVSSSMEKKNEKQTFTICEGRLHVDDVTQLTPVPSRTPTDSLTVSLNSPAEGRDVMLFLVSIRAHFTIS